MCGLRIKKGDEQPQQAFTRRGSECACLTPGSEQSREVTHVIVGLKKSLGSSALTTTKKETECQDVRQCCHYGGRPDDVEILNRVSELTGNGKKELKSKKFAPFLWKNTERGQERNKCEHQGSGSVWMIGGANVRHLGTIKS